MKAYIKILFILSLSGLAACSGKQELNSDGQVLYDDNTRGENTTNTTKVSKEKEFSFETNASRRNNSTSNSNAGAQAHVSLNSANDVVVTSRPTIDLDKPITIKNAPENLAINGNYATFQEFLNVFDVKTQGACARLFVDKTMTEIRSMNETERRSDSYYVLGFGPCLYLSFIQ